MSLPEVILLGMLILAIEAVAICAMFFQWSIRVRQTKEGTSAELNAPTPPKK